MLKMTFSKMKKLCSVALIPRILRDEVTLPPRKLGKRPLDGFWKMAKSTDSKDREAECEKCKKLIEMVFGSEKPESLLKQVEANIEDIQMDKIKKVITPNINLNEKSNDSNNVLSIEKTKKGLETDENLATESDDKSIIKNPINQTSLPLINVLKATTAKTTEEQLAQKIETIEEPGIVGTDTPKIDGFNTPPKVLGDQENILGNKNSLCTKIAPEENAMDEIAKKCLGSPPDKLDERILEEMKNCGMLGRGQKKPTSRKSGYHAMKCNDKEALSETKSEQSALSYKNQHKTNSAIKNYLRYHNTKCAHKTQNIYPAYYKNISIGLNGDRNSGKKTDVQKIETPDHIKEKSGLDDVKTNIEKENPLLLSSEFSTVVDADKKSTVINDQACKNTEILEVLTKNEDKSKEIIKNVENEVEEIRVTAAETSRLGMVGEREMDPDFDNKQKKSEILPCNEIHQTAETPIEQNLIEPNKHDHVVRLNSKHPTDWHFRPDLPERPFHNPNTAISSTFPAINQQQDPEISNLETSISSKQNPDEYFDLSHCNMEKVGDDDVITLSEIRLLAAYHQYTIITGSDKAEEPEDVMFSTKHTPEITSSHTPELKLDIPIEKEDVSQTIHKDISSTMGPLPHLRDMEEELPLTELLKRVRERNRLLHCRECAIKALEAEPVEANKCVPPLDKRPAKPPGPGPCKPKPKPACPPPPPTPSKPKDPCAKFSKTTIIGDKIRGAFTFVLQVALKPAFASPSASQSKTDSAEHLNLVLNVEDVNRMEKLGNFLLSSRPEESREKRFGNEDVILARDYEPWSPIPSWPIPKKEKKKPFVCPKEGCKIIPPPHPSQPCKENPCINFPKRTFSLIEFEYEPLYLYPNEF